MTALREFAGRCVQNDRLPLIKAAILFALGTLSVLIHGDDGVFLSLVCALSCVGYLAVYAWRRVRRNR